MSAPANKPKPVTSSARCFGRYVTRLAILRLDVQCLTCARRNSAIRDSHTVPQWWPGLKPDWTLPDVGDDGQCTRRLVPAPAEVPA